MGLKSEFNMYIYTYIYIYIYAKCLLSSPSDELRWKYQDYIYIYTWFCDVFDPRFLTFCSICCFLGIKRWRKRAYIYIHVKLIFFHLSFLSARSHSAVYVSFFQLVVIFDFSICKFVTISFLNIYLIFM